MARAWLGGVVAVMLAAGTVEGQTGGAEPFSASVRRTWGTLKGNLSASAALMPEAEYGFQPVPTVRSFGQLIGHLANDHYLICSAAKGEPNPQASTDYEKVTDKTVLLKALVDSIGYCDAVYDSTTDASGAEVIEMFGRKYTRLAALNVNLAHSSEHYGNLVTYLRLKGIVPPSSAAR